MHEDEGSILVDGYDIDDLWIDDDMDLGGRISEDEGSILVDGYDIEEPLTDDDMDLEDRRLGKIPSHFPPVANWLRDGF